MSVITLFSGIFCNEREVVQDIVESTGYRCLSDDMIVQGAAELSGIAENTIRRSFSPRTSVFNRFTQEKERSVAFLRLAAANLLAEDNLVLPGYTSLLIPKTIDHVIRICLIARTSYRRQLAGDIGNLSEHEAEQKISLEDHQRAEWAKQIYGTDDPWDPRLHDMVIPMDQTELPKAGALIKSQLLEQAVQTSESSRRAVNDFKLACQVETALACAGHIVRVEAAAGHVTLIMDQQVIMLNRLEKEFQSIAGELPGVLSVSTRVEENVHTKMSYRRYNVEMPAKVLLVDDEREFVQTLSERLQMREVGAVVAYDGPSALELVQNDAPEVMIVDLRLPGMDGMEILSQVKQINPDIEVIILTGHGSEQDRETCLGLGAFDYMQKPVDINILSGKLKAAHEKVRSGQIP
ncbi:MAG: response regulator [Desulfobacterales bacterium]|nr:response regulator [Desulfobacterales bacterium]